MSTDNSGPILPLYILRVWSMLRREETGGGGVGGSGGGVGGREWGREEES